MITWLGYLNHVFSAFGWCSDGVFRFFFFAGRNITYFRATWLRCGEPRHQRTRDGERRGHRLDRSAWTSSVAKPKRHRSRSRSSSVKRWGPLSCFCNRRSPDSSWTMRSHMKTFLTSNRGGFGQPESCSPTLFEEHESCWSTSIVLTSAGWKVIWPGGGQVISGQGRARSCARASHGIFTPTA